MTVNSVNSSFSLSKKALEEKQWHDKGSWETQDSSSQFSDRVNSVPTSSLNLVFLYSLCCLAQ